MASGFVGMGLALATYAALASGRLGHNDARYYLLNLAGTLLILASLFAQWNFPAFVTQILWIIFSLFGLWRLRRAPRSGLLPHAEEGGDRLRSQNE